MAKVKFFIDGYQLEGNDTDTVLNIARANDIFIMSTVPRAIWQQAGLQTVRTIPVILIPPADI